MKVDLHFHSKYSDGALWPNDLAEMAYNKGLKIVALTDHDTFEGVFEFITATKKYGIIGIPTIEINFVDNIFGFKSELLGYFPDGKFENTRNFILYYQALRRKVAEKALDKARNLFNAHSLDIDELIAYKIGSNQLKHIHNKISLTRRDIYTYINEKNIAHSYVNFQNFKNNFFNDIQFVELFNYPELIECINIINSDGGYAVLAHPAYQFNKNLNLICDGEEEYKNNLRKAKEIGLWGIEMHSYDSIEEAITLNKIFYDFAVKCELNITFGSDFHSQNLKTWREIGCVDGDFKGF